MKDRTWLAAIRFNDDPDEAELMLGIEGVSDGFLAVDSEDELVSTELGFSEEDIRDIIEDAYGYYDTFRWLDEEQD